MKCPCSSGIRYSRPRAIAIVPCYDDDELKLYEGHGKQRGTWEKQPALAPQKRGRRASEAGQTAPLQELSDSGGDGVLRRRGRELQLTQQAQECHGEEQLSNSARELDGNSNSRSKLKNAKEKNSCPAVRGRKRRGHSGELFRRRLACSARRGEECLPSSSYVQTRPVPRGGGIRTSRGVRGVREEKQWYERDCWRRGKKHRVCNLLECDINDKRYYFRR